MAKYPAIRAGRRMTEALLEEMIPTFIYKPGHTDRTSTTTVTLDPDLQVAVAADAVYFVEFWLWPAAFLASDFRSEWSVPSGASGFKAVLGPGSSASDGSANNVAMRCGVHGFDTEVVYSGVRDSTGSFQVVEWGVVTTDDAGTLGLSWAQGTSGASASRLSIHSNMTVTRLA